MYICRPIEAAASEQAGSGHCPLRTGYPPKVALDDIEAADYRCSELGGGIAAGLIRPAV